MTTRILYVRYSGWFQLRIGTNPDPVSEQWGGSGYTFALPGEDPLDGVIRFHDPVCPRLLGPQIGVFIRHAELQTTGRGPIETSPFRSIVGAKVDLGPDARFIGENDLVDPMIVYPWPYRFVLSHSGEHIVTRGRLPDEEGTEWLERMSREERLAFGEDVELDGGQLVDPRRMRKWWAKQKDTAGLAGKDARELLRMRAGELSDRLDSAGRVERASLSARIWHLLRYAAGVPPGQADRLHDQFYTSASWHTPLDGAVISGEWLEKHGLTPIDSLPWRSELVMRLWDGDALCGFAKGDIHIHVDGTNGPMAL